MKKNITINLYGALYNIDEDAYELLDRYMESMKRYFRNRESGEEIADDIEHRVAELLWEYKQTGAEAVDIQTVKDIIAKIGNPAEIDPSSDYERQQTTDNGQQTMGDSQQNPHFAEDGNQGGDKHWGFDEASDRLRNHFQGRRFYRDTEDKMLGGVCSGFAHYLGYNDPLIWRLIMVLLFFFTRFSVGILYIILWILVPEARTPEERLVMYGRAITPENLNQELLRQDAPQPEPSTSRRILRILLICLVILAALYAAGMLWFGARMTLKTLPMLWGF